VEFKPAIKSVVIKQEPAVIAPIEELCAAVKGLHLPPAPGGGGARRRNLPAGLATEATPPVP